MTGKDRSRYEISRHHAWAGLALLSIFLAIRYFIPFPDPSEEVEKERIKAKLEKERMKLEKKRLKAQIKAAKKKK